MNGIGAMESLGKRATAGVGIVALSKWIDGSNANLPESTRLLERVAKCAEESGEAVAATIGLLGTNPRKGVTHSREDVVGELLDVAVAALGAVAHLHGNAVDPLDLLAGKVEAILRRAGLTESDPSQRASLWDLFGEATVRFDSLPEWAKPVVTPPYGVGSTGL